MEEKTLDTKVFNKIKKLVKIKKFVKKMKVTDRDIINVDTYREVRDIIIKR